MVDPFVDCTAGEILTSVRAQIMGWDEKYSGWFPMEGGGLSDICIKQRFYYNYLPEEPGPSSTEAPLAAYSRMSASNLKYEYVIFGRRVEDGKVLLQFVIVEDVNFCQVMPTFQSWQIGCFRFGLKFLIGADASKFRSRLQKVVEHLCRLSKSSSGESYPDAEDLEDDVFVPVELPVNSCNPSGMTGQPCSYCGQWPISSLPCRRPSHNSSCYQSTAATWAIQDSSSVGILSQGKWVTNRKSVNMDFPSSSSVVVMDTKHGYKNSVASASVQPSKAAEKCRAPLKRRYFLRFFDHSSSNQNLLTNRATDKRKRGSCADLCCASTSCDSRQRRSMCNVASSYAACPSILLDLSATVPRPLQAKRESLASAKLSTCGLQPLLIGHSKSQSSLKEIVRREQCQHCMCFYSVEQNRPGSCPEAPDPFESLIRKVSCLWCFNTMLHCCCQGAGERRGCIRWLFLMLVTLFVPCMWCYFPLRSCQKFCRRRCLFGCRHKPMTRADMASQLQKTPRNFRISFEIMKTVDHGINSRHLTSGDPLPARSDDLVRVYSMRFCPYAERVLLVLTVKEIPFDVVNCNLVAKPDWLSTLNPLAKVPVAQYKDMVVYESSIICEWLDEMFPNKRLLPSCPYEKAKSKMLAERLSLLSSNLMFWYRNQNSPDAIFSVQRGLQRIELALADRFLAGSEVGWSDLMVWPWLERMEAVTSYSDGRLSVTARSFPRLSQYVARMQSVPEVHDILIPTDMHLQFIKSYVAGRPNYDLMAK
uniref:Glutathione-dependent dehydroascorbate reductase n=1 Tax=Trichuris muris TaxID=70415 RepID=A0A5S6R4Z0_TRIMR